jgi:hypothetical protein
MLVAAWVIFQSEQQHEEAAAAVGTKARINVFYRKVVLAM